MKMKYLSLALSAVLMTTLTACGGGSDSDDNYNADNTAQQQADAKAQELAQAKAKVTELTSALAKANSKANAKPKVDPKIQAELEDTKKKLEQAKKDKEKAEEKLKEAKKKLSTTTQAKKSVYEKANNVDDATVGGKFEAKNSVGTQNYVRMRGSKFNTKIDPDNGEVRGDGLAAKFLPYANEELANLVVARKKINKNDKGNYSVSVGSLENGGTTDLDPKLSGDRNAPDSLQQINDLTTDADLVKISDTEANNGLISVKFNGSEGYTTVGTEGQQKLPTSVAQLGDSRIFGYSWRTGTTPAVRKNNSRKAVVTKGMVAATDGAGDATKFYKATSAKNPVSKIGLINLQYGRLATRLDEIDTNKPIHDVGNGEFYHMIDPTDAFDIDRHLTAKRNDKATVNNYFYRGINETKNMPKVGNAEYWGQALMYGLDNEYHGTDRVVTNTNGDATNAGVKGSQTIKYADLVDGMGNFVHAKANFAKKKVDGEIYNVWRTKSGTKGTFVQDNLVKFGGDIKKNTVVGTADRTYVNGDDKARFVGTFFGDGKKVTELGGGISSIQNDPKTDAVKYDDVKWGGVFGAKGTYVAPVKPKKVTPKPDTSIVVDVEVEKKK